MKKKHRDINQIKPITNVLFSILFAILALLCVVPAIFIVIISLSSSESITMKGYSFFPASWSLEAYRYLANNITMIGKAFGVSIFATVVGTITGVILTTTMGYAISRSEFKLKNFLTWVVFIPMVFGGGLVSTYNVYTTVLGLRNNILVLILPMAVSSFQVVISKTFFKTTIPQSVLESAQIDGASQFGIFFRIVIPISKPLLATIGLLLSFGYWNDWWLSLMYIEDKDLFSLQAVLMSVERNIQFLAENIDSIGISAAQYALEMPKEPMRMAMAVVIIIPIAAAYPFFQQYFVSGLTIGAVKE